MTNLNLISFLAFSLLTFVFLGHIGQIADSIKPFGPLLDVRRRFDASGRPTEDIFVYFDSVPSAVNVYRAIQKSRRPLRISSVEPTIRYWYEDKPRKLEREEAPIDRPSLDDWRLNLAILGLPSDFKASFEIEGLITHILGLPPHTRPIARIILEEDKDHDQTIAKITMTEHLHLVELMNRTFGHVVLRGFHLILAPAIPPQDKEDSINDEAIGQHSNALPSTNEGAILSSHSLINPTVQHGFNSGHHEYHWFGSGADHSNMALDPNENVNQLEENTSQCLPQSTSTMEVDRVEEGESDLNHGILSNQGGEKEPVPQRTGPVEFSLKSSVAPSIPKTSLHAPSSSKLLPTTLFNPTTEPNKTVSTKPNARGNRHFVNIPSDRPARATLPAHASNDLYFTRGTICLLCRSQFSSKEAINRHVKESKLHASFLATLLAKHGIDMDEIYSSTTEISESPPPNFKKRQRVPDEDYNLDDDDLPPLSSEMPTTHKNSESESTHSVSSSNVGMKMLQKIGYTGGALGKAKSLN